MSVPLEQLGEAIKAALGAKVTAATVRLGELMLDVPAEAVIEVLTYLRDDPRCKFRQLIDLTGVD